MLKDDGDNKIKKLKKRSVCIKGKINNVYIERKKIMG